MSWLGDTVYSIREAAINSLCKLTKIFGSDWAKTTVIPQILTYAKHTNYLYRLTMLFALTVKYIYFISYLMYMYFIYYLLFIIYYLLFIIYYLLFIIYYVLCISYND